MPVNGQRVTTLYAYALPGPPQSFSAKTEAEPEAIATVTHQQLRAWRGIRAAWILLEAGRMFDA